MNDILNKIILGLHRLADVMAMLLTVMLACVMDMKMSTEILNFQIT